MRWFLPRCSHLTACANIEHTNLLEVVKVNSLANCEYVVKNGQHVYKKLNRVYTRQTLSPIATTSNYQQLCMQTFGDALFSTSSASDNVCTIYYTHKYTQQNDYIIIISLCQCLLRNFDKHERGSTDPILWFGQHVLRFVVL